MADERRPSRGSFSSADEYADGLDTMARHDGYIDFRATEPPMLRARSRSHDSRTSSVSSRRQRTASEQPDRPSSRNSNASSSRLSVSRSPGAFPSPVFGSASLPASFLASSAGRRVMAGDEATWTSRRPSADAVSVASSARRRSATPVATTQAAESPVTSPAVDRRRSAVSVASGDAAAAPPFFGRRRSAMSIGSSSNRPESPPVPVVNRRTSGVSLGSASGAASPRLGGRKSLENLTGAASRRDSTDSLKTSRRSSLAPISTAGSPVQPNSRKSPLPPPIVPPKSSRRPSAMRRTSLTDSPSTPTSPELSRPASAKGKARASEPLPSPGLSLSQASAYRSPHLSVSSLHRTSTSDESDEIWRGSKYVSGLSSWSRSSSPPPAVPPLPPGASVVDGADERPASSDRTRDDAVRRQTQQLAAEADRMGATGSSSSSAASVSDHETAADESTDLLPSAFVDAQASPNPSVSAEGTPKSRRRSSGAFGSLSRFSTRSRSSHPSLGGALPAAQTPARNSSLRSPPSSGPPTPTHGERPTRIERQNSEQSTSKVSRTSADDGDGSFYTPEGTPLTAPHVPRTQDPVSPLMLPTRSSVSNSPAIGTGASAAEEAERKRMLRRARAIRELVDTEWTYAQDLALARDVYMARAQGISAQTIRAHLAASNMVEPPTPNTVHDLIGPDSPFGHRRRQSANSTLFASSKGSPILDASSGPPVLSMSDVRTVFINLPELAAFSADFAAAIDDARGSAIDELRESRDDRIGHVFLQMLPRIASLYKTYCSRHGVALQRLEELTPSMTDYLRECQEICHGLSHAWSANALLVKPVQRCLKYPLLLEQILTATPPDHPDHSSLKAALERALAVAHELNEAKRRKELVGRVLNGRSPSQKKVKSASSASVVNEPSTSASTFGRVMSKKILRSGQRVKNAAGFEVTLPGDPSTHAIAETLETRLNDQLTAIDALLPNAIRWVEAVARALHAQRKLCLAWINMFAPLAGEADVRGGGYEMVTVYAALLKRCRDELCEASATLGPSIVKLRDVYRGPKAIVSKRTDKLLDLQRGATGGSKKGSVAADDAYGALTAAMIDELPTFLRQTTVAFDAIVAELAQLQTELYGSLLESLRAFESTHCLRFPPAIRSADQLVPAAMELMAPLSSVLDGLFVRRPGFGRSTSSLLRRESQLSLESVRQANARAFSAPGAVIRPSSPESAASTLHIRRATADMDRHLRPSHSGWLRRGPRSGPPTPVDEREPPTTTRDSYASTAPSFAFSASGGTTAGASSSTTSATAAREADAAHLPVLYGAVTIQSTGASEMAMMTPPASGAHMLSVDAGTALEVLWEEGTQSDGRPVWLFCRVEGAGAGKGPVVAGYVRHDRVVALR